MQSVEDLRAFVLCELRHADVWRRLARRLGDAVEHVRIQVGAGGQGFCIVKGVSAVGATTTTTTTTTTPPPDDTPRYDLAVTATPISSTGTRSGGALAFATTIQVRNREGGRESEATTMTLRVNASPAVLRSRLRIAGARAKCSEDACFVPQLQPGEAVRYSIALTPAAESPVGTVAIRLQVKCNASEERSCDNNVFPRKSTSAPIRLTVGPEKPTADPGDKTPGTTGGPSRAELEGAKERLEELKENTKWWKNTAAEIGVVVGLGATVVPVLAVPAAVAGWMSVRLDRLADDIEGDMAKIDEVVGGRSVQALAAPPPVKPDHGISAEEAAALNRWNKAAFAVGTQLAGLRRSAARIPSAGRVAERSAGKAAAAAATALDQLDVASRALAAVFSPPVSRAKLAAGLARFAAKGPSADVRALLRRFGLTQAEIRRLTALAKSARVTGAFPAFLSTPSLRAAERAAAAGFRRYAAAVR